jgi:tripartite-type tricarboxylate transporter receptor subunit TctC
MDSMSIPTQGWRQHAGPRRKTIVRTALVCAIACGALFIAPARAETAADFYHGRTVSMVVGYVAGSGYDILSRTVARFMSEHVQNVPGASSIKAATFLYNVAPKDGSVFGAIGRNIPVAPLLDPRRVTFDARKFNWLGSASKTTVVSVSWHTTPVKTIEDAKRIELIVGSPAAGSEATRLPILYNATMGTKFKVVTGYPEPQIALAIERGELGGQISWSYDSLVATRSLVQTGFKKDSRLPDVPLALDYAKTPTDGQLMEFVFAMYEIARPFTVPPGVPAERVAALRKAFTDTMHDPRFIEEATKSKIDIVNSASGDEMVKLINKEYAEPPAVIARARELFTSKR